jgi:hypothetical protein
MQRKRIYVEYDQGTAKWLIDDKSFKSKVAGRRKGAKFTVENKEFVRSKT